LFFFSFLELISNFSFYSHWKEWSGVRFMKYWGSFLQRKDATSDSQYHVVQELYNKVANAGKNKSRTQPAQTEQAKSTTSKKKEKMNSKSKDASATVSPGGSASF
jgi:hypothetical protein